jgi:hypothetical protein
MKIYRNSMGQCSMFGTTTIGYKSRCLISLEFIQMTILSTLQWIPSCRNPSFGLATKAKGLQGCGPRGSPGVTSHTLESVGKCEGVNPHTPKAIPILGDGILVDSQNFRKQF